MSLISSESLSSEESEGSVFTTVTNPIITGSQQYVKGPAPALKNESWDAEL